MIEILVVTHGNIAEELINTLKDIMGSADGLDFFSVKRNIKSTTIKRNFKQLVESILKEKDLLILTDLLGGTPTNISLPFLKEENIEILTGVNLPVLIKAVQKRDSIKDLKKLAEIIEKTGKDSVINCRNYIDKF